MRVGLVVGGAIALLAAAAFLLNVGAVDRRAGAVDRAFGRAGRAARRRRRGQARLSLTLYIAVLVYSGLLAIYFLLIAPQTKLRLAAAR